MEEIILPHANNATIPIQDLIAHFKENDLKYIIIGATHVALRNHPNPNSLDVWIRKNHCPQGYENTCQAVSKVITQLIKYESFSIGLRKCPKSNRMCKALVFCEKEKQ